MKIKTFTAKTFSEALEKVKKELSADAVILATEEKKGLLPCVEVTAAVDYDLAEKNGRLADGVRAFTTAARPAPVPASGDTPDDRDHERQQGLEDIRSELASLRKTMESMRRSGFELAMSPKKRKVFSVLRGQLVREEYAFRLCERVQEADDLSALIAEDVTVKDPRQTRRAVMFVGPTGVGKTTTIAKLAANAVKTGRKAAIISVDAYRIGAAEQIRIYSRILGIPLSVATNSAEFRASLAKFAEERDTVFIDTTGRNPSDARAIDEVADLCTTEIPLEVHLLMNANGDDEFLINAERHYRRLPISYLAFSKLDEAVRYGSLYNLALTYGKPVSYLTTGQRVPDDIEQATVDRLVGLIARQREC